MTAPSEPREPRRELEWRTNGGRTDPSHPWEMWIDDEEDFSFQVHGSSVTLARVSTVEAGQALAQALQEVLDRG